MQPMYRYSDEVVARACHAVLDIMNDTHGSPWARVPFAPFATLPPQEQDVVLEGVRAARQGATPRQLFELWADAKRALGWTWGPMKDTDRKTHPNLVDYADLPAPQRDKDQVFLAIVTAMTSVSPRLPPGSGLCIRPHGDTLGVPQRTRWRHTPVHVAVSPAHAGDRAGRCPA
jgi:hypothetical protein